MSSEVFSSYLAKTPYNMFSQFHSKQRGVNTAIGRVPVMTGATDVPRFMDI